MFDRSAAAAHLVRLVDRDSTTGREEPAVAEALKVAEELGLEARRMPVAPGRDNVLVGPADAQVLLCTHLDTVPPFLPARQDATHVHGRGSADAKGIAVAMLHALTELRGRSVAALLVVGEESDHLGAKMAVKARLKPKAIVLGEPCQNVLAPAQKGLLKLAIRAIGTSGHSAYPEIGASAIHRLLHALDRLREAALPADPVLGLTTVNVGRIEGGVAPNVIAPRAEAQVLIRCAAPVDAVKSAALAALGEEVAVEELGRAEPLELHTVGTRVGPAVPFNTDAHTLGPLGAMMLLVGPGDMRCAHSDHERLALDDLEAGVAVYIEVVEALLDGENA